MQFDELFDYPAFWEQIWFNSKRKDRDLPEPVKLHQPHLIPGKVALADITEQTRVYHYIVSIHQKKEAAFFQKSIYLVKTMIEKYVKKTLEMQLMPKTLSMHKENHGILLQKLFRPTVRKDCPSDREKLLKFEAEG